MNRKDPTLPIRVLLVEDNEHDQFAFARSLERSQVPFALTVRGRAEDIPAALQTGDGSFDIVVVDQDLPGTSGLTAYNVLKEAAPLPPFVMLTGAGSEALAVEALKAGMYDYLIKDAKHGYLQLLPLKLQEVKRRHNERLASIQAKKGLKRAYADPERKVAERTADLTRTVEALRASQLALRALSVQIVETQENERRKIARELHDSIGGSLAAVKFALEAKLKGPEGDFIPMEKLVRHLKGTIDEVRRISSSLRPSMLDELGLFATIDWYCHSNAELHPSIRIETSYGLEEAEISEVNKVVIYRVVQEAVHNALKHSAGGLVQVSLEPAGGALKLCVRDDGNGFDPHHVLKDPDALTGYGIRGMQDRAGIMGGSLTIDSSPGNGTTVCLELPVS